MSERQIHKLYTPESVIFKSALNKLNESQLRTPVTVFEDTAGHHALAHGNHRAYHYYATGRLNKLTREVIGKIPKDVSQDPNYREIKDLIVIDQ